MSGLASRFAAFLLAAFGVPAVAQQPAASTESAYDRGCSDDQGTDRCDPDIQARMRSLYGIDSAEALAEQGVTFRRVMFVDGYGNDVAAISFSRGPGHAPSVEVFTSRGDDDPPAQRLAAQIDNDTWQRVLSASEFFDKYVEGETLAGKPNPRAPSADGSAPADGSAIVMCLHAWFAVVEAADAGRLQQNVGAQRSQPASIRRDSEDGCSNGLAMPYGFLLADVAVDNLPECSSLDLAAQRNRVTLLATCHRLRGDRLAAGDAMKLVGKLAGHNSDLPQGREFDWLFATSARTLAMPLRTAITSGNASVYLNAPHASDVNHASVRGMVIFWGEDDAPAEQADLSLTLVRELGEFKILAYELGQREPVEEP